MRAQLDRTEDTSSVHNQQILQFSTAHYFVDDYQAPGTVLYHAVDVRSEVLLLHQWRDKTDRRMQIFFDVSWILPADTEWLQNKGVIQAARNDTFALPCLTDEKTK